jgi:hypothetical protein
MESHTIRQNNFILLCAINSVQVKMLDNSILFLTYTVGLFSLKACDTNSVSGRTGPLEESFVNSYSGGLSTTFERIPPKVKVGVTKNDFLPIPS